MRANQYQREVMRWLSDELGAEGVELRPGGKRPNLHFMYQGEPAQVGIAASPPSNVFALKSAKRYIRHRLGIYGSNRQEDQVEPFNPVVDAELQAKVKSAPENVGTASAKKVLSVVTDSPKEESTDDTITVIGSVAYYPSNHCLTFRFPMRLLKSKPDKFTVIRVENYGWQITPGGTLNFREQNGSYVLQPYGGQSEIVRDLQPFLATKAKYTSDRATVLVQLLDLPIPAAPRGEEPSATEDAPKVADPSDATSLITLNGKAPAEPILDKTPSVIGVERAAEPVRPEPRKLGKDEGVLREKARGEAILLAIEEYERTTQYNLIKLEKSGWAFHSTTIKLR